MPFDFHGANVYFLIDKLERLAYKAACSDVSEHLEVLEIRVRARLVRNAALCIPAVFHLRAPCDELPHLVKR